MELANTIIQALGVILAAISSIVVATWFINKNITDKLEKQNNCFKEEFELIKEHIHKQNIDLVESQKDNDNKLNDIKIEFMQEKDKLLNERAAIIDEIWDNVNYNENTIKVVENQIINIENKFNAIIKTQEKLENKIDDLYNKFNEITKYLRTLIDKK